MIVNLVDAKKCEDCNKMRKIGKRVISSADNYKKVFFYCKRCWEKK